MKQLNDTQKLFIETLKANPDGLTLAERRAIRKMALTSIDDDIHTLAC